MPMPEQPAQDAMEAALTAAIEQAREEGQPVDEIAQAAAQGAEITTEIIDTEDGRHEIIITAEDDPEDDPIPETMTVHYDVPDSARKALANAILRRDVSVKHIKPYGFHSGLSRNGDGMPYQCLCVSFTMKIRMDTKSMDHKKLRIIRGSIPVAVFLAFVVFVVQNHCPGYSSFITANVKTAVAYRSTKELRRRIYILFPADIAPLRIQVINEGVVEVPYFSEGILICPAYVSSLHSYSPFCLY